ncbi:prevent-host-death protein [Kribbella sp. NPDC059898]|uniref:prevent-host-death protein n=1 Tax=Kribbella sp. NPDC059898 TaxID=3346995 RepID=UPI00365C60B5
MAGLNEVTEHDLRTKSEEIMDALQRGHSFTMTRDGHRIGALIPSPRSRRFVPRAEFAAMSRTSLGYSVEAFREDQDATFAQFLDDPHGA